MGCKAIVGFYLLPVWQCKDNLSSTSDSSLKGWVRARGPYRERVSVWDQLQAEGKDNIARLSKESVQWQVAVKKPQNTTISNLWQLGSEKDGNRKKGKTKSQENWANGERSDHKRIKCFHVRGGAFSSWMSKYPFKWKVGQVAETSNLLLKKHLKVEGSKGCW